MGRTWLAGSVLGVGVLAAGSAHAEPPESDLKSPVIATALSLGGTVAGVGLIVTAIRFEGALHDEVVPMLVSGCGALLLGPSLGHWYAHHGWSTGLTLRLVGAATTAFAAMLLVQGLYHPGTGASDDVDLGLGAAGGMMFAAGTMLDIAEARGAVRVYNREHAVRQISITPTVAPADGAQRIGLAIVGQF